MPRSVTFRYNPVFLPEYLSTVLISIPISALFMTTPMGGGRGALVANPHLGVAIVLYLMLAGWLLLMTVIYRRWFRPVEFRQLAMNSVEIVSGQGELALSDVAEARQSSGKFFGRTVRRIHLEDSRGATVTFSDALFQFDSARLLVSNLLGKQVAQVSLEEPSQAETIQKLWQDRHRMFPAPETLGDLFSRLCWRGVCLLPVGVVDVLINLATILSLSKFQKHQLMVYSAPLSLLVSGFIARYVYYYMFTSTTMNTPLGTKVTNPKLP